MKEFLTDYRTWLRTASLKDLEGVLEATVEELTWRGLPGLPGLTLPLHTVAQAIALLRHAVRSQAGGAWAEFLALLALLMALGFWGLLMLLVG